MEIARSGLRALSLPRRHSYRRASGVPSPRDARLRMSAGEANGLLVRVDTVNDPINVWSVYLILEVQARAANRYGAFKREKRLFLLM